MKIIILVIFVFALSSCGKKEETANVAIDFNQFATISTDIDNLLIVLFGESQSGKSFTRVLDSTSFSSEIPIDLWDFHVIVWDNSSAGGNVNSFLGQSFCASSLNNNLIGGEASLDLRISELGCSLMDPSYQEPTGTFAETKIKLVSALPVGDTACLSGTPSFSINSSNIVYCPHNGSVKYSILNSTNSTLISGGGVSNCKPVSLSDSAKFNIPRIKLFNKSGFTVYSDDICDSSIVKVIPFDSNNILFSNVNNTAYLVI